MEDVSEWIDRGRYLENKSKQGSEAWLKARIGRITSSTGGTLLGKSQFKTPEEIGRIIAGVEKEIFAPKNIEYMAHGSKFEFYARRWFEETYKCKVIERGLCVLKDNPIIGASVDGDIVGTDGCIEIKCPQKMYRAISTYTENVSLGWVPPADYFDHIFPAHLHQCMQCSYVLGKKYCVYIVYCVDTQQVFTQKIPFSQEYWDANYPTLKKNYDLYVKPYL